MMEKQKNNFLSIEPIVAALEAELAAAELEILKLKHIIETLGKPPKELYLPEEDIAVKEVRELLPEIRLPLTIKARFFLDGCYTWHFLARACKPHDYQYGYYVNESELLGSGDIYGVMAELHKRTCMDLAHFYRSK
jgi:hypothetical protein